MDTKEFVRKPIVVNAVQITIDNIEELAPQIGTLRHKPDGSVFIQVNKRLVPDVFRVYPNFWMTTVGDNVRCYSPKVFSNLFVEVDDNIRSWVDFLSGDYEPEESSNQSEAVMPDTSEEVSE